MNREIKFRGWHKYMDEMYDWDTIKDHNPNPCDDKDYEIMQFTGLKDKNGKEIYEGDILDYIKPDARGAKEYLNPNQRKVVKWENFMKQSGFNIGYLVKNHFKVIGNIYENPELLK